MGTSLAFRFPGVFAASAGAGVAYGLIDFVDNNTTEYYTIPHDAILDLPTGAWAWGVWTKVDENSGTGSQYLLSSGNPEATPSFNLRLGEASEPDTAQQNRFAFDIVDDVGVEAFGVSSAATGADGVQRLVVVQSTGTTVEMWLCPAGGTATRVVNLAVNLGVMTAPTAWNLGRRSDGNTARYWEEWLGGPFKADVALSQAQIELVAGGASPVTVLGANCKEFWPFKDTTLGTNETGVVASTVATAQSGGAATFEIINAGLVGEFTQFAAAWPNMSWSTPSGCSSLVLCCILSGSNTDDRLSAITFNGVAMTEIGRNAFAAHTRPASQWWYLKNPSIGTGLSLVYTKVGEWNSAGGFTSGCAYAFNISGEHATPIGASDFPDTVATDATIRDDSITSLNANSILLSSGAWQRGQTASALNARQGLTKLAENTTGTSGVDSNSGIGWKALTAAQAYSYGWECPDDSDGGSVSSVEIKRA